MFAKYGFGPSEDFVAQTSNQSFCAIILGSSNQTSAIRGNKPTIDRARRAARLSASTKPQSIAHVCVRDRSCVCYLEWPRFACAILEDCVRIRGLPSKILGSEVCAANPRIRGLRARSYDYCAKLGWSESVLCA